MRIEKIIKNLKADILTLEEMYDGLDVDALKVVLSDKEWAALHCRGVITGYRMYLNKIEEKTTSSEARGDTID